MEMVNSGIYISRAQYDKLMSMANTLQRSRNHVIQLLIDGAELETAPPVTPIKRVTIKTNGAGTSVQLAGAIQ